MGFYELPEGDGEVTALAAFFLAVGLTLAGRFIGQGLFEIGKAIHNGHTYRHMRWQEQHKPTATQSPAQVAPPTPQ